MLERTGIGALFGTISVSLSGTHTVLGLGDRCGVGGALSIDGLDFMGVPAPRALRGGGSRNLDRPVGVGSGDALPLADGDGPRNVVVRRGLGVGRGARLTTTGVGSGERFAAVGVISVEALVLLKLLLCEFDLRGVQGLGGGACVAVNVGDE